MSKVLQQDLQQATLSPHERLRLEVQRNHLQLSFRQSNQLGCVMKMLEGVCRLKKP